MQFLSNATFIQQTTGFAIGFSLDSQIYPIIIAFLILIYECLLTLLKIRESSPELRIIAEVLDTIIMSSYLGLVLAPPPPGITPNFVNPESRGHQYVITSTICLVLMISLLILRLCSKHFISHTLNVDDCESNLGVPERRCLQSNSCLRSGSCERIHYRRL